MIIICIFFFAFTGCSGGDIADQVIQDNIDQLYLVILGENTSSEINIDGLVVSNNDFDETYTDRLYKIILLQENYVETMRSETVARLKNRIIEEGYWLLFPCNDITKVNGFAKQFGKAINLSETSFMEGYSLHYNYTQTSIQGVAHYITGRTAPDKQILNMLKRSFRDMIERRYEDISN